MRPFAPDHLYGGSTVRGFMVKRAVQLCREAGLGADAEHRELMAELGGGLGIGSSAA